MIPDYQTLMLPLLNSISDGQEYKLNSIVEKLAIEFNLTPEERSELLPSGQTFLFGSRVGWARTYLKKAGLIDSPKRGTVILTDRGRSILNERPKTIDVNFLKKFPEFVEFQSPKKGSEQQPTAHVEKIEETPEELIESGYLRIRKSLEQEIILKLKSFHPAFFEKIVVALLEHIS